jgi:hypothetical protein
MRRQASLCDMGKNGAMSSHFKMRLVLATVAISACSVAVAVAQQYPQYPPSGVPTYHTWQSQWTQGQYDRAHVVLGIVAGFSPYRLTVAHRSGMTQTIDLKPGTAIFPTGQTPSEGEHVAVIGYWSKGTFIAERVILRP